MGSFAQKTPRIQRLGSAVGGNEFWLTAATQVELLLGTNELKAPGSPISQSDIVGRQAVWVGRKQLRCRTWTVVMDGRCFVFCRHVTVAQLLTGRV